MEIVHKKMSDGLTNFLRECSNRGYKIDLEESINSFIITNNSNETVFVQMSLQDATCVKSDEGENTYTIDAGLKFSVASDYPFIHEISSLLSMTTGQVPVFKN